MPTIRLLDETTSGTAYEPPALELADSRLTLRDLIALRVRAEVRDYNNACRPRFYGLVQPTDVESLVNGPKERRFKPIDADRQVQVALEAFRKQQFFVLLKSGQVEDLDQVVSVDEGDTVSFLRLVPLVGG